jgi:hypothetical protein
MTWGERHPTIASACGSSRENFLRDGSDEDLDLHANIHIVDPASAVAQRFNMVLQKMIEEGLLLVQGDPQHDLKLGFRC